MGLWELYIMWYPFKAVCIFDNLSLVLAVSFRDVFDVWQQARTASLEASVRTALLV